MGSNDSGVLSQVVVDPKDIVEKTQKDLNILAMLCLFDIMRFKFPDLYVVMWELMKSKVHLVRDFSKIALGIPRGFAKTTFVKLFIVYCILFTDKKFILVVSYAEEHAISVITDVIKMLASINIRALFGNWDTNIQTDQKHLKIFSFRGKTVIIKAVGAKGGIRGLNEDNHRPDVIILEDYQKKDESENEDVSKKQYEELVGTIMKAKSPFGCLYLYVANMYPTPGSILKKLKLNPDWIKMIVGGIKADGTSLWEDLHPIHQLFEEYMSDLQAGVPQVFLSEVLNDETAGIKSGIDITKLPLCPFEEEDELPQGRAIVIDPALDNPSSDYNGIGQIGIFDGIPVLEDAKLDKFNPLQLIKESLIMAFNCGARLIVVENFAYQASLLFWFNKICEDNGIEGFIFMPLNMGGGSKNAKILAALRKWQGEKKKNETTGEVVYIHTLHVKRKVRPLIINEIIKFNPTKKNNQDTCLDLLVAADKVVEQYRDLTVMPYEAEAQSSSVAAPRSIEENCLF